MSVQVHECVGALLLEDGRILLGRRSPRRRWLADAWDVFGGHVEPGETAPQALKRELDEELGIVVRQMHELPAVCGHDPEPWRLQLYAVTQWQGVPWNRQPHEHVELRWCTLAEAQALLGAAHPDFARLLAEAFAR